jgi:hypothetical protein
MRDEYDLIKKVWPFIVSAENISEVLVSEPDWNLRHNWITVYIRHKDSRLAQFASILQAGGLEFGVVKYNNTSEDSGEIFISHECYIRVPKNWQLPER